MAENGEYRFSLNEIRTMPTLHTGQERFLKLEKNDIRIYLSRPTVGNNWADNHVTVHQMRNGKIQTIDEYDAI